MASAENHVLTWNLRDVRAESIQSFSTSYGLGWQIVGELRPDVAQSIAATFGARAARVGVPVKISAWRLSGLALRVSDILAAAPITDSDLNGYAVMRARAKTHELHLDRTSLDSLIATHGAQFDDSILELLKGTQLKRGAKPSSWNGRPVILYLHTRPADMAELRAHISNEPWLTFAGNADRIVVVLWCTP